MNCPQPGCKGELSVQIIATFKVDENLSLQFEMFDDSPRTIVCSTCWKDCPESMASNIDAVAVADLDIIEAKVKEALK